MKFNVKHTELKEVSDTILKDSEDYSTQIDNMISLVDNLRSVWSGEDALIFCDNFDSYLSKMKNIPIAMRNMSNAMNTVNKGYQYYDEMFGNALNREANNYEE